MRASLCLTTLVATLLATALPAQATRPLNDTGQTQCLTVANQQWHTRCQGSPQDGGHGRDTTHPDAQDGLAGFAWQRVCNSGELAGQGQCPAVPTLGSGLNQQGCVLDQVTGLLWEIKSAAGTLRDYREQYRNIGPGNTDDVTGFVAAVNAQGLCGRTGWRLPTVLELQSLLMYDERPTPLVDPNFWPRTLAWTYWTSEPTAGQAQDMGWVVSFGDGSVLQDSRYSYHAARLVHDGLAGSAPAPGSRWVPVAAGQEIHDTLTGLIWRRCAQGQTWNGRICKGAVVGFRWQPALTHSQNWASRTGKPWRLPNVKELRSVIDASQQAPALNRVAFPGLGVQPFWTSTALHTINRESWQVDTQTGAVQWGFQSEQKGVWLVRDAP